MYGTTTHGSAPLRNGMDGRSKLRFELLAEKGKDGVKILRVLAHAWQEPRIFAGYVPDPDA